MAVKCGKSSYIFSKKLARERNEKNNAVVKHACSYVVNMLKPIMIHRKK